MNYISFAGYDPTQASLRSSTAEFQEMVARAALIGKDILIPAHGIYWLIMLHALGFPDEQMPQLLVHGWWNISGAKMSKSVRQCRRSRCAGRQIRRGGAALLPDERHRHGKDADFSGGTADQSLQHRPS